MPDALEDYLNDPKYPQTCRIKDRNGRYYIVKLCPRKARVLSVDVPYGAGFLVNRSSLRDIQETGRGRGLFPGFSREAIETEANDDPAGEEDHDSENSPLPYGVFDLDPTIVTDRGPPLRVKCYVKDCEEMLRPPTRGLPGDTCPRHGIRCHFSGTNATYTYADATRNIIVSPWLFANKLRRNPHKFESHRFGYEKSEDAVSWNVFRSFQEARILYLIAQWITGTDVAAEPYLFLWGLSMWDDRLEPWDLLIGARQRFENRLPVSRPATEPDIALYLPGQYLILIEAKFTSENTFYAAGPRRNGASLTKEELVDIYKDPRLKIIDVDKARDTDIIFYQLYRNTMFAEYMALLDGKGTKAFHASLVRAGYEHASTEHFRQLIRPEYGDRFARITWEQLHVLAGLRWRKLARLMEYMATKTAGLVPAFQLDLW